MVLLSELEGVFFLAGDSVSDITPFIGRVLGIAFSLVTMGTFFFSFYLLIDS